MKAELRPVPHGMLPGHVVVEIWYGGELLGTVVGADGPGVRVISKHHVATEYEPTIEVVELGLKLNATHVYISK